MTSLKLLFQVHHSVIDIVSKSFLSLPLNPFLVRRILSRDIWEVSYSGIGLNTVLS